jgi:hypothetical protein
MPDSGDSAQENYGYLIQLEEATLDSHMAIVRFLTMRGADFSSKCQSPAID